MAVRPPARTVTPDPMGDTVSGMDAGQDAFASSRFLLCYHSKPRNTYFLHGGPPDPVLVWAYIFG